MFVKVLKLTAKLALLLGSGKNQISVCLTAIHRRAFPSVKRMHPGEWLSDLRYFGGMAATSMLIL